MATAVECIKHANVDNCLHVIIHGLVLSEFHGTCMLGFMAHVCSNSSAWNVKSAKGV